MDKPGAVIGASPGAISAPRSLQSHLRYVARSPSASRCCPLPKVYFSFNQHGIDAAHNGQKQETSNFVSDFIAKFDRWIGHHRQAGHKRD